MKLPMELPPLPVLSAVTQRYARLLARFGDEFGERPLVLPTSKFFPDKFTPDAPSLARLVSRMQRHAGIDDIPITAVLVGGDEPAPKGGGCGSGACSTIHGTDAEVERLVDRGDGWQLNMPAAELGHPVVLTTQVARTLGLVFLLETRNEDEPLDAPPEVTAELAAVALGFGALLLEGSYIYAKSCGGPTVARATALGVGELGFALALFAAVRGLPLRGALAEVGTTQRALLDEARSLVDSNASLVQGLKQHPERVARGDFALTEARPWLVRVLGKRSTATRKSGEGLEALGADASLEDMESLLATLPAQAKKPAAPKARDAKRDELRALVDEALSNRAEAD
jgi:hypothetical protein